MKPEDSPNDGNDPAIAARRGRTHPTKDRTDTVNRPHHSPAAMNPTGEVIDRHEDEAEKASSRGNKLTLFEQVLEPENLARAWKQVKTNKGAPGIDGMTIEEFPRFIRKHWETIQRKLRDGSYRPAPVKRIYIPKPDGTRRPLGHTNDIGSSDSSKPLHRF